MYNNQFSSLVAAFHSAAAVTEAAYVKENGAFPEDAPATAPLAAFGGGAWRERPTHFPGQSCSRCGHDKLTHDSVVEGCRMNGDGYGVRLHACTRCGLADWHCYDEA